MTKDHLWGISHLGSNGVFVFGESVEIGAERMPQGVVRPRLDFRLLGDLG
jgi:hypothetical protein